MPFEQIGATTHKLILPSGGEVEIGDKDSVDFKPTAKLTRLGWDISLLLGLATTEKILPTIQGEKMLWQGKDYGAEFYQARDGFKFNIILTKKPLTNVFPLDFNSENLNFYYQPPLTEEYKEGWNEEFQDYITVTETEVKNSKGEVCVHRPENVVGSYAVYHSSKRDHILGQTNYGNGKAWHWLRPLIWDSVGNKCWGVLFVGQGIRTVTIPQEFLDNAVYPVTIDDDLTFGADPESPGGSSHYTSERLYGLVAVPASDGAASKMSVYCKAFSSSFYGNAIAALYISPPEDEGETDDEAVLHASTDETYINWASAAWGDWDFGTPPTVLSTVNDKYALVLLPSNFTYIYYDTVAGEGRETASLGSYELPDPAVWNNAGSALNSHKHSIYCTYTPSGGGEEKFGADTGSGADAKVANTATLSRSETGSGTEALGSRDLGRPEVGSGADALSALLASITGSETGSGLDAVVALITAAIKYGTETGSGLDASSLLASVTGQDTGSGIEALIGRALASYETGSGAGESILIAAILATETGAGVEHFIRVIVGDIVESLLAEHVRSETGSGVDAILELWHATQKYGTDSGAGVEAVLSRAIVIAETGAGAEEALIQAILEATETGAGLDAVISLIQDVLNKYADDVGAGVDAKVGYPGVVHTRADAGSGAEAILDRALVIQETGTGADVSLLLAVYEAVDSGTGLDALVALVSAWEKISADSGVGDDVVSAKLAQLFETGAGLDATYAMDTHRMLRVAVVLSQYRKIQAVTSKYRKVQPVTSKYRKTRVITSGG